MDGAVGERRGERVVHATVLVEERHAVECGTLHGDLEVVARARAILDVDRGRVRERLDEQCANRVGLHRAIVVTRGTLEAMRLLRAVLLFKLGFWAGMIASAAVVKRLLRSRGDADSDEVALVAILDGVTLKSHARAFRGGSMLSWFGGIAVDLREAELAPSAHLDVHSLFGGVAVRVPPEWRIESQVKALGGGVAVSPQTSAPDAPTLTLDGFAAFGGVAVGNKPAEADVSAP